MEKSSKKIRINIDRFVLIHTFKQFKNKPQKVFVAGDFSSRNYIRTYLDTLIRLGLIKQVPGIYYTGAKHLTRREVKGYRLILE